MTYLWRSGRLVDHAWIAAVYVTVRTAKEGAEDDSHGPLPMKFVKFGSGAHSLTAMPSGPCQNS